MVSDWNGDIPYNKELIRARARERWVNLRYQVGYLRCLIMSMPHRLQKVIHNNGAYTPY